MPVGCVIVHRVFNTEVARGRNETNKTKNGTRHCEFVAIEKIADAASLGSGSDVASAEALSICPSAHSTSLWSHASCALPP